MALSCYSESAACHSLTSVTEIGNDGKLGELSKGQETPEFFETEGNRRILGNNEENAM